MVEVIKLFIIWKQQQLPFALFLQARKSALGHYRRIMPYNSVKLANQSACYIGYKHKPYNKGQVLYNSFAKLSYSPK